MTLRECLKAIFEKNKKSNILKVGISKELAKEINEQLNDEDKKLFGHVVVAFKYEEFRKLLWNISLEKTAQSRYSEIKKINKNLLRSVKVPPSLNNEVIELFKYMFGVDDWQCICQHENHTKYCVKCGREKGKVQEMMQKMWRCDNCGTDNYGEHCTQCGNDDFMRRISNG